MTSSQPVIGVEIGGTKLQAVLGHASGQIDHIKRVSANASDGADTILLQLEALVNDLLDVGRAAAIGIGFGGPVDEKNGRVIKSHQVAGWEYRPLASWAQETFGLPCRLGNDSDMAALAEANVGAGQAGDCVFYTNIGSGIGGGLVRDGQPYTGRHGAMEFGHTWVYSELEGRWGRLEDFCSGWALTHRAREMATTQPKSVLAQLSGGCLERIDTPMVFSAWQQDDPLSERLLADFFNCYGRALANVVALLNPDVIVIGGGVAQVGAPLLAGIRNAVERYVFPPFAKNFTIAAAQFGEQSVPVGALLLAADCLGQD